MSLRNYKNIFIKLLLTDLFISKKTFIDKIIDSSIWTGSVVAVSGYIMPYLGTGQEYGVLIAVGAIVGVSGFERTSQVAEFISDLESNRLIDYHLSLPIPNWLLFIKTGLSYSLNSLLLAINSSIICSVVLWNQLAFSNISIAKYVLALFSISLFFGFFTLLMISMTKDVLTSDNTFMRFTYPLWVLGGFQFSWSVLYKFSPTLAIINLMNPYIYATEILRGILLGQENFIPFWYCIGTLTLFTIIAGAISIYKIKRRLDYV